MRAEVDLTHPVLLKLESYAALTDEDRALVAKVIATEQPINRRIDLIREEENPDCVHLVTRGFACRYKSLANGKRQIVAILLPGDFCDLNAYMFDAMDHSIATLVPSSVAKIPKETMAELLGRPAIASALFKTALVDGATLREWIANIGARNAENRVAHLFCELHARLHAVGLTARDGTSMIPMSQIELSEALGLSLVHTNRSIKKLKAQGLLTHRGGVLTMLDAALAEKKCGFTANYLHLSEPRVQGNNGGMPPSGADQPFQRNGSQQPDTML